MHSLIFYDSAFWSMPVKASENFEQSKNMNKTLSVFLQDLLSWQRRIKLLFKDILGCSHYCYINCFTVLCLIGDQIKPINFKDENHSQNGKDQN